MSRVGRRGVGVGTLLAMCVLAIPWRVHAWQITDDIEFRANYRNENYMRLPGDTTTTYIDPFTSKLMTEKQRHPHVAAQRAAAGPRRASSHRTPLGLARSHPLRPPDAALGRLGVLRRRQRTVVTPHELTPYWSNNITAAGGLQGGQNAVMRNNADPLFREYYLDIAPKNFFFRIGRQIIPWGKSDGVYMLDVINPFDLRNPTIFEEENFKIPVWAANMNWKPTTDSNLQVLYIPKYLSNVWGGINVNRAGQSIESRFHDWTYQIVGFFNDFYNGEFGTKIPVHIKMPSDTIGNSITGLRWSDTFKRVNYTVNYLYTFTPSLIDFPNQGSFAAPHLNGVTREPVREHVIGGSADYDINMGNDWLDGLVLRGESAFTLNDQYYKGLVGNPADTNHWGVLLGFDKTVLGDYLERPVFASLQYWHDLVFSSGPCNNCGPHAHQYQDLGFNGGFQGLRDNYKSLLTLYLSKNWLAGDTLISEFFLLYELQFGDWWIRPKLTWKINDLTTAAIGFNIFAGSKQTPYGQWTNNTNAVHRVQAEPLLGRRSDEGVTVMKGATMKTIRKGVRGVAAVLLLAGVASAAEVPKMIAGKPYSISGSGGNYTVKWGDETMTWTPKPWMNDPLKQQGPAYYAQWAQPGMEFPFELTMEQRDKLPPDEIMDRCIAYIYYGPYHKGGADMWNNLVVKPDGSLRETQHFMELWQTYVGGKNQEFLTADERGDVSRKYMWIAEEPQEVRGQGGVTTDYYAREKRPSDTLYLPDRPQGPPTRGLRLEAVLPRHDPALRGRVPRPRAARPRLQGRRTRALQGGSVGPRLRAQRLPRRAALRRRRRGGGHSRDHAEAGDELVVREAPHLLRHGEHGLPLQRGVGRDRPRDPQGRAREHHRRPDDALAAAAPHPTGTTCGERSSSRTCRAASRATCGQATSSSTRSGPPTSSATRHCSVNPAGSGSGNSDSRAATAGDSGARMNDESQYHGLDLRLAKLARFLIRRRREALVLQLLVLAACIWAVLGMRLYDDPNAWPPKSDPFVQLNQKIASSFGGGNSVSITMTADEGTVFTKENLGTIKDITDALYLVHGVIPYAVRSIAALEAKRFEFVGAGTEDEQMMITPLMPERPKTDEDAQSVEAGVKGNPLVYGVLVSKDLKTALILADFRSVSPKGADLPVTEPVAIYHAVSGHHPRSSPVRASPSGRLGRR